MSKLNATAVPTMRPRDARTATSTAASVPHRHLMDKDAEIQGSNRGDRRLRADTQDEPVG